MFNPLYCTRKELSDRYRFRCIHRKNGFEHPKCFLERKEQYQEKIAFLDIEAESLDADFGIVFCWVIKDFATGKILKDCITKADMAKGKVSQPHVQPKEDKRVVDSLLRAIRGFDRVVCHYGCGYDIPFVRTRAVINGLDFPKFGELFQSDTWMMLKKKFKLSRNSLENGTRTLLGKTRKNRLSLSLRHGCLRGEPWALKYTLVHCIQDVEDLYDLYCKINKFSKKTKSSI